MTKQLMEQRHSVRSYLDKPLDNVTREKLRAEIESCNAECNLHFQLITDEPKAFDSFMAHYGKFSGVSNYVVFVAPKGSDEKVGYYGQRIALFAQSLGLNTCWVALTYKKIKNAFSVLKGEKLYCVLTVGYGATQGSAHKIKTFEQVADVQNPPEWFRRGVEAALLAPTAMNQQKFSFSLYGDGVRAKAGTGFYTKIDLGIVKYHFELGAGKENFHWTE